MKGLCSLKKERKEKVHNFTQRFVAYLKKFTVADKRSEKALIEYYTLALGPDLAMFSKMSFKPTLSETCKEAEKESIEDCPMHPKDEQSHDFEGMLKMMQKLSKRVIDLEKEKEA